MAVELCVGCVTGNAGRALIAAALVLLTADTGCSAADEPRTDLYGDPLSAGAIVRLGTVRYRNAGGVAGMVFSGDGESIIVAAPDGDVTVLEVATGRPIREFTTEGQAIVGLRLAPDRQAILTIGEESDDAKASRETSIRSWDPATGTLLSRVSGIDSGRMTAFDISRDGKVIVTVTQERTLTVSDSATGNLLAKRSLENPRLDVLAVSPDGKLVIISRRNELYLWEWQANGDPEKIPLGRNVLALAFSADGAMLAEGPDFREDIVLRDVATRKVLRKLSDPNRNRFNVGGLAFSANGKSLATTIYDSVLGKPSAHGIVVWDVATGEIRRRFSTGSVMPWGLALSDDGHWLAARVGGTRSPSIAAGGEAIRIWDLRTGAPAGGDLPGHITGIDAILYSPGGRTIVTAGSDGTLRVWDAATGRQTQVLRHDKRVRAAAVSPDGALIASSSLDNTVRLWETATGREVHRFPGHGELGGQQTVAFSPDGERFVSWGDDMFFRIRNVKTGEVLSERRVHPPDIVPPDENGGEVRRDARMPLATITGALFSADSRRLAIRNASGVVYLFDGTTGNALMKLGPGGGRLLALALSPDGKRVATCAVDRRAGGNVPVVGELAALRRGIQIVCVREIADNTELADLSYPEWGPGPVAFSGDGQLVAVAGRAPAGKIRILTAAAGDVVAECEGPRQLPQALAFSPDGKRLACGLSDGTALIWDVAEIPAPQP